MLLGKAAQLLSTLGISGTRIDRCNLGLQESVGCIEWVVPYMGFEVRHLNGDG